ncbi:MAG: CvpA family protein [Coprococcus sp.]
MNLLLMIILAVTLLLALIGYKKGLFKSAVSAIGIVLAVFLTTVLSPYVNTMLCDKTELDEYIKEQIETRFQLDTTNTELTRNDEMRILERITLPENVKEWIIENGNKEMYDKLNVKGFTEYISVYLTTMVMKGLSYVVTFFVLMLIIYIFIDLADVVTNIPIINGINKAGGILFGLCQSLMLVWIAFVIITFLSAFEWGAVMMKMIDESAALSYIYEKNIFLKFVVDILGNI